MARIPRLPRDTPCAALFLDETGAISHDRFFAVGVIKVEEPSRLLRAVIKLRDKKHWYQEFKFSDVTQNSLPMYQELTSLAWASGEPSFYCFVADRLQNDPIARFGDPWSAYLKMAEQLVIASVKPREIVSVVVDNYSTPDEVLFEEELRQSVNRRLRRLGVTTVTRMDSRSTDALQIVDLFTSASAFEFRANAGLASKTNPKAALAQHVRELMGATSVLTGHRAERASVQIYDHNSTIIAAPTISSLELAPPLPIAEPRTSDR